MGRSGVNPHVVQLQRHLPASPTCTNANMIYVMGRALERWVEDGIAPEQVIGTKFKSGSNPASGVARTRPLCPTPKSHAGEGSGSTDDAANFVCMKPESPASK